MVFLTLTTTTAAARKMVRYLKVPLPKLYQINQAVGVGTPTINLQYNNRYARSQ